MLRKYRLLNNEMSRGVYINDIDIYELLNITYSRSNKMFNKICDWLEYINNEKINRKEIIKMISENKKFKHQKINNDNGGFEL